MQTLKPIIIDETDILKDRIITYDEFMQIFNFVDLKYKILYGLLAITGARPCEVLKLRLDTNFDFSNKNDPKVKIMIAKAEKQEYNNFIKKKQKIVWRPIPEWFMKYLSKYIYETRRSESLFLFPKQSGDTHMNTSSVDAQTAKLRHKMFKHNPKKYEWVLETYKHFDNSYGFKRKCYRFSLYSFRKMHSVLYLKMMQDKGDVNAIVATSKHMGHSDIKTTLKYLAIAINDRFNIEKYGFMNTPPLQELSISQNQTRIINY